MDRVVLLFIYLFIYYEYRTKYTQKAHIKNNNNKMIIKWNKKNKCKIQNYEVHKNSIKPFKTKLLNKCNSK